jgi:unsaturated rhamnogalacturonyl hydrolase
MTICKKILFSSALLAAMAGAAAQSPRARQALPGSAAPSGVFSSAQTGAQTPAIDMAATAMDLWKDSADTKNAKWTYDEGVVCLGLEGLWRNTGDARYYKYIQKRMDRLVDKEGNILTYKREDYNLDNVLCGRVLLMLYKVTNQEKYYKAAQQLRQQLKDQPRTHEGSFWHKK